MTTPALSIVIPAYEEGERIVGCLDRILAAVARPCEVLVVYDTEGDSTAPWTREYAARDGRVVGILNPLGAGPAKALRAGIEAARGDVVVVTMADGCDDVSQIEALCDLVDGGAVVAAASRYSRGGAQLGGPRVKSLVSRAAGLSLHYLAGVGTKDATNSFKGYRRAFVLEVGIESDAGFEIGLELVAKAHRRRLPIAELPTVWRDRTEGTSHFKLARWAPRYLAWYRYAFGRRLLPGDATIPMPAATP